MKDDIHEIKVFENVEVVLAEPGHVRLSTVVVESSLNYYGKAHGGYLYTLGDQLCGLVVKSLGQDAVTLQSSINYFKSGQLGDTLTIDGICQHNGRTTKVIEVTISNQEEVVLAKINATMFVTG